MRSKKGAQSKSRPPENFQTYCSGTVLYGGKKSDFAIFQRYDTRIYLLLLALLVATTSRVVESNTSRVRVVRY